MSDAETGTGPDSADARLLSGSGRPAPDPEATAVPGGLPVQGPGSPGRETVEREVAWARGQEHVRRVAAGEDRPRDPYTGIARTGVAHRAFAALAENVRDYAIFLMEPDGVITFWGEGARLIKWWTKEQAEGAHLRVLYPDGGSEDGTAEDHLIQSAEQGEYTGEGHRIRGDGSTFWAGITLTALRDEGGALIGFAKVTRDLTARRAADAAMKAAHVGAEEARRHAEEASRAKSLFLATISHEIRTPLNAIMAYADLLEMELAGPLTDQQRGQVGRIRTSSMHLLGIVNDVLDFSRVEAGRTVVERTAGRIGAAVDGALALVSPQAEARGVDLVDAVSGHASEVPYWGDEERLRQIVLNLLSNSVKFTARGGRITVSAGTAAEPSGDAELVGAGPWAYVRVEDTGQGIPADRLGAIFEPFVQADMSHTRSAGGTGLGLAISRRLARLMGGDVTVRSQEGVGSTFFVWLPAAPEEALNSRPMEAAPAVVTPGILQEVRDALLAELERVLHAFVARLRGDPDMPSARAIGEAELEDHLASFLSDLAQTLGGMELEQGQDAQSLRDGTAIQRVIAERHGLQRFRLGWSPEELRREHEILGEELAAAIRRRVRRARPEEVEETLDAVGVFLSSAERISMEAWRKAAAGAVDPRP